MPSVAFSGHTVSEDARYKLATLVEGRYRDEYEKNLDLWRDIERKAQGLIAAAGILLTALFGIAKTDNSPTSLELSLLISLITALLAVAILSAFLVLRTRKVSTPPRGEILEQSASEIKCLLDAENSDFRLAVLIEDQFPSWRIAVQEIKKANKSKASDLFLGQVFILMALLFLFGATIAIVFG